jgi:hypothetical protein
MRLPTPQEEAEMRDVPETLEPETVDGEEGAATSAAAAPGRL